MDYHGANANTPMTSLLYFVAGTVLGQAPADSAFFEAKVRPVLAEHCFKCHGPAKAESGLRLDSRSAILKGGHSGPAMVVGVPEKSLLIQAVRHMSKELKMPKGGKQLPAHVIAD